MKILFIHPNMPGQYKHLARIMAEDAANQVVFITKQRTLSVPGVTKIEYKVSRSSKPEIHRYVIGFEQSILQGQEVWRVCNELKAQGFTPDIICAHPGWGDALFVKDIYPNSVLLNFLEFYYHAFGADVHFDKNEKILPDELARIRVKNAVNLLNLEACDWGVSPTWWQKKQHPKEFHHKISVIHDGIDTDVAVPMARQKLRLPNGVILTPEDKVVTYVCRNFEPYRGFPTVMRGIEKLTRERSDCHVLIVGNDGVSYGRKNEGGKTHKQVMLEELTLDMSRVHFIDTLPYKDYLKVLQHSDAHIYFTVPFVLSWSSMEAMSAGCLMVGSDTQPVREVIQDGVNGLLTDFFSPDMLAKRLHEALDNPEKMQPLRAAARQTIIDKYSLHKLIPLHMELIRDLADRKLPPPAANKIKKFNSEIDFDIAA
jgi:glycosyltransferase involved in cell wall biosynthesis